MGTLTQNAEDLGTINKFDNTFNCNTVLLKVNPVNKPDIEVLKVIKEYADKDSQFINGNDVDVVDLLSQASTLCAG